MDPERLKPILEAALLAAPQPLTPSRLAELFDETERPTPDAIGQALHALAQDCESRGVELVEVGSGFRYQVRGEVFPQISGLWTERQTRYSRALLETLSLIAYRQPITRGEIEQIRGVAVATSILRTLEEREWVRVVGHRDVPGRPALYGTTRAFLDYFQLKSLDELPPLSALRDLDTLEPELALELGAPAAKVDATTDSTAADAHASHGAPGGALAPAADDGDMATARDRERGDDSGARPDGRVDPAAGIDTNVVEPLTEDVAEGDSAGDGLDDPNAVAGENGDVEPAAQAADERHESGREGDRDPHDAAATAARD